MSLFTKFLSVEDILADFHKIVTRLEAFADLHLAQRDNKAIQIEQLKGEIADHEAERLKATEAAAKIKELIS